MPLNIAWAASLINFNGIKLGTNFTKHFPVYHCVLQNVNHTHEWPLTHSKNITLTDKFKRCAVLVRTNGDSHRVENASRVGNAFIVRYWNVICIHKL